LPDKSGGDILRPGLDRFGHGPTKTIRQKNVRQKNDTSRISFSATSPGSARGSRAQQLGHGEEPYERKSNASNRGRDGDATPASDDGRGKHDGAAGGRQVAELWRGYNLHLARVVAGLPAEVLTRPRMRHNLHRIAWRAVPETQPVTLDYFVRDYVGHLENHLTQILPGYQPVSCEQ
jgi:hypothetical protein